jgi:hypothetical protein
MFVECVAFIFPDVASSVLGSARYTGNRQNEAEQIQHQRKLKQHIQQAYTKLVVRHKVMA